MAGCGDTRAHSALLGIALGVLLAIDLTVVVVVTCRSLAVLIVFLQEQRRVATDTLLGLLSHSALALGLVAISFMERLRIDLMSYLFGDILAIGIEDIAWIYAGAVIVLGLLALIWRPMLAVTVHDELRSEEHTSELQS